ncbi:MAG: RluA family pseudouridine synthase [Firmicutes bacterium]|nr:RluA family pseudouridine synthase [Bacillota bacterium]
MIFSIPEEYEGKTVLFFLKQHLSLSRGIIISLKNKPDGILQNGKHVTVRALLSCGDELALMLEDTEDDINEAVEPVCLPVEILYEDEDIIAVNKPGGMATHPSHNHHGDTLANALAYYFAGRPFVFRAAGRLDRDTSGVVLVSKSRRAANILSKSAADHNMLKSYIAVSKGIVNPSEGVIEAPIGREKESIITRVVKPAAEGGQYALTKYRAVTFLDNMTLLEVNPITGRTHQIRVHFSYIGHPLVGDTLYGCREGSSLINRQALHCSALTFCHPITGETMTVRAELPGDIKRLLDYRK